MCFLLANSYGQNAPKNYYSNKVEEFILEKKLDSARYFLDSISEISYKNALNKFIKKEKLTYQEYYTFIARLGNRQSVKIYKDFRFYQSRDKRTF